MKVVMLSSCCFIVYLTRYFTGLSIHSETESLICRETGFPLHKRMWCENNVIISASKLTVRRPTVHIHATPKDGTDCKSPLRFKFVNIRTEYQATVIQRNSYKMHVNFKLSHSAIS